MSSSPDRSGRGAVLVRPLRADAPARPAAPVRARFDEELVAFVPGAVEDTGPTAEEAFAAGYEAGLEEGMARGRAATAAEQAAHDRRVAAAVQAISTAAAEVTAQIRADVEQSVSALVEAAYELAEAMVRRELRVHPRTGEEALRQALAIAPERMPCIARLNPADLDELHEADELLEHRDVTLQADPLVEPGDCVLDLPNGRIELRIDDAIERVRSVVLASTVDDTEVLR